MIALTLSRYFAVRFFSVVVAVFAGVFVLVVLIDYVVLMRRGFGVRQKSAEGQSSINANSSREQGALLGVVTIFAFDASGRFRERIEAKSAELRSGRWRLEQARVYAPGTPTRELDDYSLNTN